MNLAIPVLPQLKFITKIVIVAHSLRVRFNMRYLWIGLGQQKWTHV